jgi:hypothetical protein
MIEFFFFVESGGGFCFTQLSSPPDTKDRVKFDNQASGPSVGREETQDNLAVNFQQQQS